MIPRAAKKPADLRYKRSRQGAEAEPNLPMPRKAPFLDMTALYIRAGTADEVIRSLADNPEAQALFAAEIAYSRGEIDNVIAHTSDFLRSHSGFCAVCAGGAKGLSLSYAESVMWLSSHSEPHRG